MNRVYKVIWCKATQAMVAVSEFAKSKGKDSSHTNQAAGSLSYRRMRLAKLSMALFLVISGAIGIAKNAFAQSSPYFNIGTETISDGKNSFASGLQTKAEGDSSTTFGAGSKALGAASLATGGSIKYIEYVEGTVLNVDKPGGIAYSDGSIAMGTETVAGTQKPGKQAMKLAIEKIAAEQGISLTTQIDADNLHTINVAVEELAQKMGKPEDELRSVFLSPLAKKISAGPEAVAIGYRAKAIADKTMVLGFDAEATVDGGFALGSNAKADTALGKAGYDLSTNAGSTDTSAVWKSTMGALAIGDAEAGKTRQITGLAAGTDDDDAVNVAQLKKTARAANRKNYVHVNSTGTVATGNTTNLDDVDGVGGAKGIGAIAIGMNTVADGKESIVIGGNGTSQATGENSVVIGKENLASGLNAVAIGRNTKATGGGSTAMGQGTIASGDLSTATGWKTKSQGDASMAMGYQTQAMGFASVATGRKTIASGLNSFANGLQTEALGDYSASFGAGSRALGVASFVTGGSQTYVEGSKALGKVGGTAYSDGSIAMGTETVAGKQKLGQAEAMLQAVQEYAADQGVTLTTQVKLNNPATMQAAVMELVQKTGKSPNEVINVLISSATRISVGPEAVAIGYRSQAIAEGTMALGFDAKAEHKNSVALGSFAQTREEVDVNSTTIGGIAYSGFAGEPDGVVSIGKKDKEKQLIHVAAGEISATSTDAINGSQLYVVAKTLDEKIENIPEVDIVKGTNIVKVDKTTASGKNTYTVNAEGTNVSAGSADVIVSSSTDDTSNDTTYTVKLSDDFKAKATDQSVEQVVAGSGIKVTSSGTEDKEYTVSLLDATKDAIDNAVQAIKTEINGQTVVQTLDKSNNIAKFNQGKNIVLSDNNGSIQVATADEVAFDKVTVGNVVIDQNKGINAGSKVISHVATGVAGTDAVNVEQLTNTVNKSKVEVKQGTNVLVSKTSGTDGHDIYTVNAAGTNVAVGSNGLTISTSTDGTSNDTTYTLDLSSDIKDKIADKSVEKVVAGSGIKVTSSGTEDKAYTVALDDVTKAQLKKEESVISTNGNVAVTQDSTNGTGGKEYKLTLASDLLGINSIGNTAGGAKITLGDTDKNISVNGGKLTNVKRGTIGTDAVNLAQLEEYVTKSSKPTEITVSGGMAAPVGKYSDARGKNLQVKKVSLASGGSGYDIKLTDKVTLGIGANQVVVDGAAGNVKAGQIEIAGTAGRINNLTNKTFNPNNFTSGQAATEDQLKVVSDRIDSSHSIAFYQGGTGSITKGNYTQGVKVRRIDLSDLEIDFGDGLKAEANKDGKLLVYLDKKVLKDDSSFKGKDGKDGRNGKDGKDGRNGKDRVRTTIIDSRRLTVSPGKNIRAVMTSRGKLSIKTKKNLEAEGIKVSQGGSLVIEQVDPKQTKADGSNPTITRIDMGGNIIQNVAPGRGNVDTDVATMANLRVLGDNLYKSIKQVSQESRAGIAGSAAIGLLAQPNEAGEALIGASLANHKGETALAVGVSASSDNNKWIVKGAASIDTQKQATVGVSVNYKLW